MRAPCRLVPTRLSCSACAAPGRTRLGGALLAALFAASAGAQPAPSKDAGAPADGVPRVELDKLKRNAPAAPQSNLFGARSWESKAPPKKAPPPPPPPPPLAPPLPFTYLGRWIEGGETTVMIGRGAHNYTVRAGEKIDPAYLLEKIEADRLVFRYVPLDQTQILPFAASAPGAVAQPVPGIPPLVPGQKRGAAARDADDEED